MQPIDTRDESGHASDGRLVDGVARGEPRAFDAIVLRYSGELLRYARRLGLGEQAAEDVLQQSLLKAWISLDTGTRVRALRPWLYRIVHNNAVNAVTRQREVPSEVDVELHKDLSDGDAAHLDRVLDVRAALADVVALPQMQRDAILLSAVDGRSHDEVAEVLGVSDGAVRGLLHRARVTLRAAAASVVPVPLFAWFGGSAARLAPVAGRVAESGAPGGGIEVSAEIAKGAALAATAAVFVAGVAIVHPHATAPPRPAPRPHVAAVQARQAAVAGGTAVRATGGLEPRVSRVAKHNVRQPPAPRSPSTRTTSSRATAVTKSAPLAAAGAPESAVVAAPVVAAPPEAQTTASAGQNSTSRGANAHARAEARKQKRLERANERAHKPPHKHGGGPRSTSETGTSEAGAVEGVAKTAPGRHRPKSGKATAPTPGPVAAT